MSRSALLPGAESLAQTSESTVKGRLDYPGDNSGGQGESYSGARFQVLSLGKSSAGG